MVDNYTVYPEGLKKRIEAVDKTFADEAREREHLASLTPEQQDAEIKKRQLLDSWWEALSSEDKAKFEALSAEDQQKEINAVLEKQGHEPITEPIFQPESEPETVESLKSKLEKTEQSLRSLQGKYEKEPAELQRQNNFLQEQITLLQRQISELQTQGVKPKEERPAPKKIVLSEVLKEDIDGLKQELAPEIVDKIVKFSERTFELGQKIGQETAQQLITEVAVKFDGKLALSAKEKFDKDLGEAYPNWRIMWKTPEFQTFLAGIPDDDLSGAERYVHIQDAFNRNDSRVVIKAFDLFTGKKPEPDRKPNLNQSKLENRVWSLPTSSPGGPKPTKPTDKMTPQEARVALAALTASYGKGQYRGSKADYDKEYAKLHALCEQKPPG